MNGSHNPKNPTVPDPDVVGIPQLACLEHEAEADRTTVLAHVESVAH